MSNGRLLPGATFVHFRVVRLLGEGGMGAVYEAEHEFTKRRVALKIIHTFRAAAGDFSDRMVQEARALADLSHPNVVTLYDANVTDDGIVWLATEYLEGQTLGDLRRRFQPLPVRDALHYLIEACDGVAAAHEIGIIHRDLKPENIFVTRQGKVKVLDFGAAKVRDRGTVNSTDIVAAGGQRRVIGTPEYMSPEHLGGLPIDERTDVYALGIIGYELLHKHPHSNADGSYPAMFEMCRRQVMVEPPPLVEVAPQLPPFLSPIFARAMQKHPGGRQGRVADLVAELRAALRACEEAPDAIEGTPFEPRWTGPGAYAVHGPKFSLPQHEPVEMPSRAVVVAAGEDQSRAANGTVPLSPGRFGGPASSVRAADSPRSFETPAFTVTQTLVPSPAMAAHVRPTTQPATVPRDEPAANGGRRRRRKVGTVVAAAVVALGAGVFALAGRAPSSENPVAPPAAAETSPSLPGGAADAGVVVAAPAAIAAEEDAGGTAAKAMTAAAPQAPGRANGGAGDAPPKSLATSPSGSRRTDAKPAAGKTPELPFATPKK